MKFWKKIFLYSLILFLLLFNSGGIILIEKIHSENLNNAIKSLMYKSLNIESIMYLNTDYLMNIDVYSESNLKNWMNIITNGYSLNSVDEYNTELYSMENKEITSDLKEKITGERKEISNAKKGKKSFIIRTINNRRYAFVSSIVNLENRDFKLIISRDIQHVYTERINNYKFFLIIDIIILIILSIGMYIISKNLTKPLVNLSNISKDIAKGKYDIRVVESKENDEIGVLEHNFNFMIDVIENNIEELKTLNESKQRFIDSLNHEIKTPITSIIGYSELLLKSNINEEIKMKAYKYINSEAKRLETLNSTLLKLTLIREENGYYKNNNYILKLTDYGIGIPKEDLDKIIEPFYMVDKARTRKNNGIGLGLSICNEICNLHDISLSIESKLNIGTSIILEFNKENYLNEI